MVDGSSHHYMTEQTLRPSPQKAGQCSICFAFHVKYCIIKFFWKKMIIIKTSIFQHSCYDSASNRILLEKISSVCITLISLNINISSFRLKNASFFFFFSFFKSREEEKKKKRHLMSGPAPCLQASSGRFTVRGVVSGKDSIYTFKIKQKKTSRALANNVKHAHNWLFFK